MLNDERVGTGGKAEALQLALEVAQEGRADVLPQAGSDRPRDVRARLAVLSVRVILRLLCSEQ